MYTKTIPHSDFKGKPQNKVIHMNLTENEVFKNIVKLQAMFEWMESVSKGERREMAGEDVVEFYTNFEDVLLEAWGEPSDDGQYFDKTNRYKYASSALHAAAMKMFVTDPQECAKMLDGIIPDGLADMVKEADANLVRAAEGSKDAGQTQAIQELMAQNRELMARLETEK